MQFQPVEKRHDHFNHFGVDGRRVAAAQNLRANLIKLPVASFLRALAPEHRPDVIQLDRLRKLLHPMFDIRATYAGGGFWTQRNNIAKPNLTDGIF